MRLGGPCDFSDEAKARLIRTRELFRRTGRKERSAKGQLDH